jgi:4-amino-4-deoxy-L-arabinose transferase-like glycosyltransferase
VVSRGAWLVVFILAVAALWLRLNDLGRLGLIADEGHQALAVRGVLERGVPLVPSGNIYLRGAPFIYAEALTAASAGVSELALRLPAALFGAGAVILIFLFARMLFGLRAGLIAAFLLAFSVWEISLSRYARMYTLLQLCFLGAAACFYRGYLAGGGRRDRVLAWVLGALAAVTHQLGIFVILFYPLPLFVAPPTASAGRRVAWPRLLVPALLLALVWFTFHAAEGRLLERATPPFPGGASTIGTGSEDDSAATSLLKDYLLVPPVTLALELRGRDRLAVLAAAALAALAAIATATAMRRPGRFLRTWWALAILAAAFLNLAGIALGLAVGYLVLLPESRRDLGQAPLRPAWIGAALLCAIWCVAVLRDPSVLRTPWGERSLGDVLFGYPPVAARALSWFLAGWPLASVVVSATLVVLAVRFAADRRRARDLFAAGALLLPLLAASATREIHNESRYHFHLYPFIVTLLAAALAAAARFLGDALDTALAIAGRRLRLRPLAEGATAVLLALLVTPDIAPRGLAAAVAGDYRTPRDPVRSPLSWLPYATFHQDHAAPAALVAAALEPDDKVLVAGPPYWASIYLHYIGRVDYVVAEGAQRAGRNGVTLHHVTGARTIRSPAELDQVLAAERGRRVWILTDSILLGAKSRYFSPDMKARLRTLASPIRGRGRDGVTVVACFDRGIPAPGGTPGAPPGEAAP